MSAFSQLSGVQSGVAVLAHIGGFVAGALLVKLFEDRKRVAIKTHERHRLHPDHY